MCNIGYTNFQREGSVVNMTAEEALSAVKSRDYRVIYVWEHKTNSSFGSARLAVLARVHQLLIEYLGTKSGSVYAFTTSSGERVKHLGQELEKLGEYFGQKFLLSPTLNRKFIATAVSEKGSECDVRGAATHMTHSLDTHRSTYQQKGGAEQAVSRYVCEVTTSLNYDLSLRYLILQEASGPQGASGASVSQGASGSELQQEDDQPPDVDCVPPPSKKRRMAYTKEEEEELVAYFGPLEEREKKAPKTVECKAFLQQCRGTLKGRSAQNIQDKLKSLVKRATK